ncbi:MDR family MFS transporter [Brevibacillus fluminis]|uniref:MDR family MFS transporter n=1 Tax=Brevibacillus fluminis TaxID=511487 RepID=UPI003F89FBA4
MDRLKAFVKEFHPIVHSLVIGTIFVRAASSMSMPFLFIYLSKNTDMSLGTIGLIIGAGSLAGMIGGFVGGALSDMIGRRRVMLGALYVWAFVFLGFAFGKGVVFFFLLNLLGGLCRSFYEPVSQALMADVTAPEKRFRVFSLRYTAINVGVAVGPLIGTLLAMKASALPFTVTAIIYLLYAFSLQRLLNHFGIKQIEGQKKEPVTFRKAWNVISGDAAFRLFILGGTLGAFGYSQMSSTLSKFTEMSMPNGAALFAVLMSVNALAVVTLQHPFTRWMEKRPALTSIIAGNVAYALGDIGYAFATNWAVFIISMVVFTIGEILTYTAGDVFIDGLAPEHMRGTYFGAKSFSSLGSFLGPWLGGILLAEYGGAPLFITCACVSTASNLFYWMGQRKAHSSARTTRSAMRA